MASNCQAGGKKQFTEDKQQLARVGSDIYKKGHILKGGHSSCLR